MIDNRKQMLEQRKLYDKQYRKNNQEKIKKQQREYYKKNREKIIKQSKLWKKDNAEREKERKKQYRKNNINKIAKYAKQYNKNHYIQRNQHSRNRYKTDLAFNLNCRMSRAIGKALKNNKAGKHWEDLVGYTCEDLIKRLKMTLPQGCTWDDFLSGKLEVDHIIPKSIFNFSKPKHIDFRRCWALKNLQLLPARENLIKSNYLTRPFQPALQI